MIIDLKKPRNEYFENPSRTEIMRALTSAETPDAHRTISHVKELSEAGKLIVGTKAGTLEQLMDDLKADRTPEIDTATLMAKIAEAKPDQLILLPPNYSICHEHGRHLTAHSMDTFPNLENKFTKKAVLGRKAPKGRVSKELKIKKAWTPENVIKAFYDGLHKDMDNTLDKYIFGYSWFGSDNHRRIVSLYRAIQGAELRAFQNYAALKYYPSIAGKEIQSGIKRRNGEKLDADARARRLAKIARQNSYKNSRALGEYLEAMRASKDDMIEPIGTWFGQNTGRRIRVPSRSQAYHNVYVFKETGIPFVPRDDQADAAVIAWEFRGKCYCKDKDYRSDYRKQSASSGQDEDFICAHEIAAAWSLYKIAGADKDRIMPFLPLVLPTPFMMDNIVDPLRQQSLILNYDAKTHFFSLAGTNNTVLDNLCNKAAIFFGYDKTLTTSPDSFKKSKTDIQQHLIKFR